MSEPDWTHTLMDQLDRDEPGWYMAWATGEEGTRTLGMLQGHKDVERAQAQLKGMIARRLFHRVINAAISAGIVKT